MDVNRKGIIRSNKSANNKLGRRVSYSDGISYDRGGGVKQEDKPEGHEILGTCICKIIARKLLNYFIILMNVLKYVRGGNCFIE